MNQKYTNLGAPDEIETNSWVTFSTGKQDSFLEILDGNKGSRATEHSFFAMDGLGVCLQIVSLILVQESLLLRV
jgi:hypothetical protein